MWRLKVAGVKDTVTVEFRGHSIDLAFDFNAQADAQAVTGLTITPMLMRIATAEAAGSISVLDVRAVIWGSMRHSIRSSTLEDAGALMGEIGVQKTGTIVAALLRAAGYLRDEADDPTQADVGNVGRPKKKPPK